MHPRGEFGFAHFFGFHDFLKLKREDTLQGQNSDFWRNGLLIQEIFKTTSPMRVSAPRPWLIFRGGVREIRLVFSGELDKHVLQFCLMPHQRAERPVVFGAEMVDGQACVCSGI